MADMTIVRVRSGWAVRFGDGTRTEAMTRRAAGQRMARVAAHRAECAAEEAAGRERVAALLESRGIGPVDFRDLQPGDLFTWRPEVPPKTVTGAKHLDSGASVIEWERGRHTPSGENVTLMTPGYQAYGRTEGR